MTEEERAQRLAREPKPIQDIYRGLCEIIAAIAELEPEAGSPLAALRDNSAVALAEFRGALECDASLATNARLPYYWIVPR